MTPFQPLFLNPHLQTIAGHLWRRDGLERWFPVIAKLYCTEPGVQVLIQTQRPAGLPAAELVIVHGLEGSGEAGYVRGLSAAALRAGLVAHRFHLRTCGGTERLSNTLYHAGLTSDLLSFLRSLAGEGRSPLFVVGFSLGGNIALKLAGELGTEAPKLLTAVCAVSTPLDLAACARCIGRKENWLYESRFLRRMRARLLATGRYQRSDFARLRSVMEIDERITAPSFGFGTAANYYRTQSALSYLDQIRIRVLLIHAKDDTLAPFAALESNAVRCNARISVCATDHGGHIGFLGRKPSRFWLDKTIMEWIGLQMGSSLVAEARLQ